jgi:hypothetical protein
MNAEDNPLAQEDQMEGKYYPDINWKEDFCRYRSMPGTLLRKGSEAEE